jgi:hypothetical protein
MMRTSASSQRRKEADKENQGSYSGSWGLPTSTTLAASFCFAKTAVDPGLEASSHQGWINNVIPTGTFWKRGGGRDMSSRKPDQPLTLHLDNLAQQSPLTRWSAASHQDMARSTYISIGLGFIVAVKGPQGTRLRL